MRASSILYLLSAASIFLLSGCGTLIRGQTQEISLATPGATEAECTLDHGIRYKIKPGQTIRIMRSGADMKVDCYASNNREKHFVIPRGFNAWSAANIANGLIPGVTYDHLSKGLYEYPALITVDFSIPGRGYEPPQYHNKDAPNPYEQTIESYTPGQARVESDSGYIRRKVERTGMGMEGSNPFAKTGSGQEGMTPMPGGIKDVPPSSRMVPSPVPRGGTAESLNRTMNPSVFRSND